MKEEAPTLQVARLPRRLLGMSIDLVCAAIPVWVMLRTDVLSRKAFNPEAGWFYSEWLLRLWLDHPPLLTAPLLWWMIFGLGWQLVWEVAIGRTPGAWSVGVAARSMRDGGRITWWQALLRVVGSAANIATLGLGYALCFIFREGRGLHEIVSLSVTAHTSRKTARSSQART